MNENTLDINYRFFVIDERPLCLWDTEINSNLQEFLDSIDPKYFEYIADVHLHHVTEDHRHDKESQYATLVIRAAYSQALETLFALLCASIQAPHCVHAWIDNYQSSELYSLVDKITSNQPIKSQLSMPSCSWSKVADYIFRCLVLEDKDLESQIKKGFSQLWSWFAKQFLDESFKKEYNSIKHGLRVSPGGFDVAVAVEDQPGVPPTSDKYQMLGSSKFGSSFIDTKKIGDLPHHIHVTHTQCNWHPVDLCRSLHLISLSIQNIKLALKILNGLADSGEQFHWPSDMKAFQKAWEEIAKIRVLSINFPDNIQPTYIKPYTKGEILDFYKAGDYGSVRHIIFSSESTDSDENNPS